MTDFLPIIQATANRKRMQGRLVSLFVMLAILFGTVMVPASAQAKDMLSSHGAEVLAAIDQPGDCENCGGDEKGGDAPCHVATHHHCSVALSVDALPLKLGVAFGEAAAMPQPAAAMSSLSQAPPTQPPAA